MDFSPLLVTVWNAITTERPDSYQDTR
jgi:hypothetical protein